jgi:hypothetical protein
VNLGKSETVKVKVNSFTRLVTSLICGYIYYNNNSIQFIYLRACQQPNIASYSQAQKQQHRLTLKNKRKHNKGTIRNLKDINQYESIQSIYLGA